MLAQTAKGSFSHDHRAQAGMKTRVASFVQLQELFRAAESTTGPLPADGASDAATASSARPQHNSLQSPAQPERSLLHRNSLQLQPPGSLAQQHSLGLLERRALGEQTRLRVGLPARGGSKTFSISSGLGSELDLPIALGAVPSPRPLQPYGGAVATLLSRRCGKAQRMLAELQRPVFSVQDGGERPPLPAAALRFCKVCRQTGGQADGLAAGWRRYAAVASAGCAGLQWPLHVPECTLFHPHPPIHLSTCLTSACFCFCRAWRL